MKQHRSQQMKAAAAIMFLVFSAGVVKPGNIPTSANRHIFEVLCKLERFADRQAAPDGSKPNVVEQLEELDSINMSLASEDWQKLFAKNDGKEVEWDSAENSYKTTQSQWATHWKQCFTAKQNIKPDGKFKDKLDKHNFNKLTELDKEKARPFIAAIIAKAQKYRETLQRLATDSSAPTKTSIDAKINDAVHGDASGKEEYAKANSAHTNAKAVTNCNTGGKINSKETIDYALMCVCATTATGAAAIPCGDDAALGQHWGGANPDPTSLWNAVIGLCPAAEKTHVTANEIRRALSELKGKIRLHSNAGYLGFYTSNACNGNSASGICINYGTVVTNSKNEFNKVHYAKMFLEAANDLDRRQKNEEELKEASDALNAAIQEAWHAASIGNAVAVAQAASKSKENITQSNKKNENKAEEECNKAKDDTECKTKTECTYDATNKKCTLSKEGKQAAENSTKNRRK